MALVGASPVKITIESAPDKRPGEFLVSVTIDDPHEHFWFETDHSDAMRIMHEVTNMIRQYFLFQRE